MMIHILSKTYGRLPTEILFLDSSEVELNYLILEEGMKIEKEISVGKKTSVDLLDVDPEEAGRRMDALFAVMPGGVKHAN